MAAVQSLFLLLLLQLHRVVGTPVGSTQTYYSPVLNSVIIEGQPFTFNCSASQTNSSLTLSWEYEVRRAETNSLLATVNEYTPVPADRSGVKFACVYSGNGMDTATMSRTDKPYWMDSNVEQSRSVTVLETPKKLNCDLNGTDIRYSWECDGCNYVETNYLELPLVKRSKGDREVVSCTGRVSYFDPVKISWNITWGIDATPPVGCGSRADFAKLVYAAALATFLLL